MDNQLLDIQKAIDYIEANIKNALTLEDMASAIGFSKYHFSRVFKKWTGYNAYDYYRGRKVTEAVHYMLNHSTKIIDAAYEYGFSSPEVFTRSCLQSLKLSPSQIRKSLDDHSFEGIKPLDVQKIVLMNRYRGLEPTACAFDQLILKGRLITTEQPNIEYEKLKELPLDILAADNRLTILHWPNKNGGYNHLVGTIVGADELDINELTDDIYKLIPANEYLCFPLVNEDKEFENMREFIYDYYVPTGDKITPVNYEMEAVQFGQHKPHPKKSLLHIPVIYKGNNQNLL